MMFATKRRSFMARSIKSPEGQITLRNTDDGVSITAIVPGYAGHVVGRATLPAALRALADALEPAAPAPYADDAATFADVAHDDSGLFDTYDLLEGQVALWAINQPADTQVSEGTRYVRALTEALLARIRANVEAQIADHGFDFPFGVDDDIAAAVGDDDGGEQ
jgi:hypothetical protein